MNLHKDGPVFEELIESTAVFNGMGPFQVEKDYFVSLFLKTLVRHSDGNIVFKGGTSLSKCYGVIDRFSEDIDLSVNFNSKDKVTQSNRKKVKEAILKTIEQLGMTLLNEDKVRSKRDYNKYEISYNKVYDGQTTMIDHIIVETIVAYKPYPYEELDVSNYIYKNLKNLEESELITHYGLSPFKMKTQTIERTFIDKVFAVADYHINQKYNRNSRHLYDIHKLWKSDRLDIRKVHQIMNSVIRDRQKYSDNNKSCKVNTHFRDILKTIATEDEFRKDFESVTTVLIFNPISYEECIASFIEVMESNLFPTVIEDLQ